ncbi:MAG: M20/M25/M40 family metallo-hydrolase [Chloroflexi bacterium]|nr:M20/M25/M40 family metallo-hydrolase [Chloroflexota bacterium]
MMSEHLVVSESTAIELLHGLVAVPSLSRQEAAASAWLVGQMQALGYTRAFVDAAGNAVGEMGAVDAPHTVVLLGHIDTVPGNIPVRVEKTSDGAVLFGRGSVDAKGPLATFVGAVAKLGAQWALDHNIRVVVVGAVEEESASSKGARFIRDRFDGLQAPLPVACIIGEPSSWQRVTLGYKGRILVELEASQPMAHTAGPDAGVAIVAVDLWNWISAYAANFNQARDKTFEQFQPSLRGLSTFTDAAMHDHVTANVGIRLPLDFDVEVFKTQITSWAIERVGLDAATYVSDGSLEPTFEMLSFAGPLTTLTLRFHAHEQAWRSDRNSFLVRSFLSAIRQIDASVRPTFVVKSGTSDMNVVGPAWHCPILAYGPGDNALDHTPNEHVNLAEYWKAVLVLEQALRNLPDLL